MTELTENERAVITKYDLYYESRMTKVESELTNIKDNLKEIKSDLRWMLGIMGTTALIVVGIMAHGFHWF